MNGDLMGIKANNRVFRGVSDVSKDINAIIWNMFYRRYDLAREKSLCCARLAFRHASETEHVVFRVRILNNL